MNKQTADKKQEEKATNLSVLPFTAGTLISGNTILYESIDSPIFRYQRLAIFMYQYATMTQKDYGVSNPLQHSKVMSTKEHSVVSGSQLEQVSFKAI